MNVTIPTLYALQVALSIKLIVTMVLFFKLGPLKSFISQPSEPRKLAFHKGCEMKDFNGSNFYSS